MTTYRVMQLAEFKAYHELALELHEVKHGLILNALGQMGDKKSAEVSYWTLGRPGECAIKMGRHSIVLAALDEGQCRKLASLTAHTDYPGVIGPDLTARWFTDRARELGLRFLEPQMQQIYSISDKPRYPGARGHARPVTIGDAALLADWLTTFQREADSHDPLPPRAELARAACEDRILFWSDNGQPVSMAGIERRLKHSAAITRVYTPPELRRRGYAGSATAAAVERIYAEGRKIACLYVDLRNPASNRCYAKIGFAPVCKSLHFYRQL